MKMEKEKKVLSIDEKRLHDLLIDESNCITIEEAISNAKKEFN